MGRIVVTEFISLDGVMEDPGGAEGFERGGWVFEIGQGEEGAQFKLEETRNSEALLLGRTTYEGFAAAWPERDGEFADMFNSMPKYVVSSTLERPEWNNSNVLGGDVVEEVTKLRAAADGDIVVHGSARLVQTLIEHDLVDELRLMVFPIVIGSGKRLFAGTSGTKRLRLAESRSVGDGVVISDLPVARRETDTWSTASDSRQLVGVGDDPERRECFAGMHGWLGAVPDRRGDAGVEAGVVAPLGRHANRRCIRTVDADTAPRPLGCEPEIGVGRRGAAHERRLLAVEAVDDVPGGRSQHAEARPGPRREPAHREVGARAVVVQQREERLVCADAARTKNRQLGRGQGRGPEQLQRLVDEVAAEIEHDPGSLAGGGRVLPAPAELGRPALERRLEAVHLAERFLAEQLAHGEEVAIPAAVLEDHEGQPGRSRGRDQLLGLGD